MTTFLTAEAHVEPPAVASPSWLAALRASLASVNTAVRQRMVERRLREQFASMDDRMLRDIGFSEVDVAALRAGEPVLPSCLGH